MSGQAIPQPEKPAVCPKCGKSPCQCVVPPQPCPKCGKLPCVCTVPPAPCPKCGKIPCVCQTPPPTDKLVDLTFTADRDQLFTAWNAMANLTEVCRRDGEPNIKTKATLWVTYRW